MAAFSGEIHTAPLTRLRSPCPIPHTLAQALYPCPLHEGRYLCRRPCCRSRCGRCRSFCPLRLPHAVSGLSPLTEGLSSKLIFPPSTSGKSSFPLPGRERESDPPQYLSPRGIFNTTHPSLCGQGNPDAPGREGQQLFLLRGTTVSVRRVLEFRGCLSWYRREAASICDRSSCAKSVSTLYNSRVNKHRGAHRMLVSQLVKGVLVARGPESLQNHLHHLPHP